MYTSSNDVLSRELRKTLVELENVTMELRAIADKMSRDTASVVDWEQVRLPDGSYPAVAVLAAKANCLLGLTELSLKRKVR